MRRQYEKQAGKIATLQRTIDHETRALAAQHREARDASETTQQGAVRFSLGGTAVLAIVGTLMIVGTLLQVAAAFV
ncbi:hypothetical protein ACFVSU_12590 [Microbacterium sp. NPDC058062]|uniref:hypothetical protein n=1 Tax=Microbacterium sp. NPDC058062 TaxID=3346320 RepID=UPI0036DEE7AC